MYVCESSTMSLAKHCAYTNLSTNQPRILTYQPISCVYTHPFVDMNIMHVSHSSDSDEFFSASVTDTNADDEHRQLMLETIQSSEEEEEDFFS